MRGLIFSIRYNRSHPFKAVIIRGSIDNGASRNHKYNIYILITIVNGATSEIRTPDLRITSALLWPAELRRL